MSARVEIYRERPSQEIKRGYGFSKSPPYRWRFVSSNGRVLADSGQGYVRRIDALSGCAVVLGGEPTYTAPGRDRTRGDTYIWRRLNPMRDDGTTSGEHIPVRDLTREAKP